MSLLKYQLVVFGATGFMGRQIAAELLEKQGATQNLRWAIAGRSINELNDLKRSLSKAYPHAKQLPIIVADAKEKASLISLCMQTSVVINAVGPYTKYGEMLVDVCATSGTDYCDLVAEIPWMVQMLRRYEGKAKESGARLVFSCGFSSIVPDLGVYYLQQHCRETLGKESSHIKMRIKNFKSTPSKGMILSIATVLRLVKSDKLILKLIQEPYLLADQDQLETKQPSVTRVFKDKDLNHWTLPLFVAGVYAKTIHRTNYLLNYAYSKDFLYEASMFTEKGLLGALKVKVLSLSTLLLGAPNLFNPLIYFGKSMWLKAASKSSDKSPEDHVLNFGYYDVRFFAKMENHYEQLIVAGNGDPARKAAASMITQAALCLLKDVSEVPGGVWTPAAIFGEQLIERLQEHADIQFKILERIEI